MWQIEFEWRNVKEKSTWREGRHACKQEGEIKKSQHGERGATQFQAQAWAPGKKTSGAQNWRRKEKKSMNIVKLISFWYLNKKCRVPLFYNYDFLRVSCIPPHLSLQCRLVGKRARDIVLKMGKEVNMAPHHPLGRGRTHVTNRVWMEKR